MRPNWTSLYEVAEAQDGHFTTAQASEQGYSPQHLQKHIKSGRILHVRRGIYRLVHFPAAEHEYLTVVWLWSERRGVLSHETALSLQNLSDVLPSKIHITLPTEWLARRLRVPDGVIGHFAAVDAKDTAWYGAVPITKPARTIRDCVEAHSSPETIEKAIRDARTRGIIAPEELAAIERETTRAYS